MGSIFTCFGCKEICLEMVGRSGVPRSAQGYQNMNDGEQDRNVKFFKNEIKCEPDGDYIDRIHALWWTDYIKLERHHGYIQWLFPLREPGLNPDSQPLQQHEIQTIRDDPQARDRLIRSYEMMIGFYGAAFENRETGELTRATNWADRLDNLNRSGHNNRRITRILKCLGLLGEERFQLPFVRFLAREVVENKTIPNCLGACRQFWIPTLDDAGQREMYNYIKTHEPPNPRARETTSARTQEQTHVKTPEPASKL